MKRLIRTLLRCVLAAASSSGAAALLASCASAVLSPGLAAGFSAGLLMTGCSDMGEPEDGAGIPGIDVVEGYEVRTYSYSAYDTSGRLLVTGRLRIAVPDTGTFSRKVMGTWEFERRPGVRPEETGPQDGKGSLDGIVSGDEMDGISMNLNPGFVDNNVILHGSIGPAQVAGTWSYIGFPGVIAEGPFTASRLEPSFCCWRHSRPHRGESERHDIRTERVVRIRESLAEPLVGRIALVQFRVARPDIRTLGCFRRHRVPGRRTDHDWSYRGVSPG